MELSGMPVCTIRISAKGGCNIYFNRSSGRVSSARFKTGEWEEYIVRDLLDGNRCVAWDSDRKEYRWCLPSKARHLGWTILGIARLDETPYDRKNGERVILEGI